MVSVEPGFNFRKDASSDKGLDNSVKEFGILEPILVRVSDFRTGRVTIVNGHRRFNAALKGGQKTIPCMHYGSLTNLQAKVLSLAGTEDAKPLSRQERCEAYFNLQKEGLTEAELTQVTGRSLATVREYLAVMGAAPEIRESAGKDQKDGGIDARTAARAAHLPRETQERIAPELKGKSREEGTKIVQGAAAASGVTRPGRRPSFGPAPLPAAAIPLNTYPVVGVYKTAPDFAGRLQEIERRTRLKINKGVGQKSALEYVLMVIECLKGNLKIDDIDGWKGVKG